ncbi:MAG: chemotaxis protein CheB, partial [Gammaproteobacteria bacterium]
LKALARRGPGEGASPPAAAVPPPAPAPADAAPLPHAAWRAATASRRSAPAGPPGAGLGHALAAVLIGASTGGPAALQQVLGALPAAFPVPVLLVQHMPAAFTPLFAHRLDGLCRIAVREAADGDPLQPGVALLAPGGRQMTVEAGPGGPRVRVREARPGEHYRPSVDLCFASAAEALEGRVLAVVLTGMGEDGRRGAERLKARGAQVWAQDRATSMIWGMPRAVEEAGLADRVLPLERIGPGLARGAAGLG